MIWMAIATVVRSLVMNSAKPPEPLHPFTFRPSRVNVTVDVKSNPGIGRAWSIQAELDGKDLVDGVFSLFIVKYAPFRILVDVGDE